MSDEREVICVRRRTAELARALEAHFGDEAAAPLPAVDGADCINELSNAAYCADEAHATGETESARRHAIAAAAWAARFLEATGQDEEAPGDDGA